MNTACPRRVSLISALGLPTILSPTIGATSGDRPAARRFGSRLSPALQASSFARRLAHPHRPNRVHRGCPLGQPVLRTGRSRSVALHPALLRCSYGSIPHSSSPHRSGLSPLYPTALSGARAGASRRRARLHHEERTRREADRGHPPGPPGQELPQRKHVRQSPGHLLPPPPADGRLLARQADRPGV